MYSISMPKNVTISWNEDFIKITGNLGSIVKKKGNFSLAIKDSKLFLWSLDKQENLNFYYLFIKNMIVGVTQGYKRKLRLIGVGYKAFVMDNFLYLKIGYSHEIKYKIPAEVKIYAAKTKGSFLLIKGIENFQVNQVAAEIRRLRAPDSYKGKGIHYENEILNLKKGKREGK